MINQEVFAKSENLSVATQEFFLIKNKEDGTVFSANEIGSFYKQTVLRSLSSAPLLLVL